MDNLKKLMLITASVTCLTVSSHTFAASTDVVLNLEGNPTCSSLGDNQAILTFRDTDAAAGVNEAIVDTTTGGTQTITYEIGDIEGSAGIVSWSLTGVSETDGNPINYIILKGQGGKTGARVYHYGASTDGQGGEGSIGDDTLPSTGTSLSAVSFCYGLTTGFTLPDDGTNDPVDLADVPLPSCEELNSSDLFTTQITCPAGGEEQLIINMALNKPNFGFDFGNEPDDNTGIRACTCNASLPACNPSLAAQEVNDSGQYLDDQGVPLFLDENGEFTTTNTGSTASADNTDLTVAGRSCLEYVAGDAVYENVPAGVNERVPFSIQGVENPDSYICYVWGGRRYCYGHY